MRRRLLRAVLWVYGIRLGARAWLVRIAMFYFGYRILHHEVYDVDHADALLVFVGLWLCGIPPLTLLAQLRDAGMDLKSSLDQLTEDVPQKERAKETGPPGRASDERESGDSDRDEDPTP